MPGRFAALKDDSSSSGDDDGEDEPSIAVNALVPSYEDLSTYRADEETVLGAVYGSDFTRLIGTWGYPKLQVIVRPPSSDVCHTELTLSVQLGKHYPYVIPTVELLHVKGLSKQEQATLLERIKERMVELAGSGTVMVIELVQLAEDFLLEHNQDPTLSAWEQMKAREAKEKQIQRDIERQWLEHSSSKRNTSFVASPLKQDDQAVSTDIQKELARQRDAIDAATRQRDNGDEMIQKRPFPEVVDGDNLSEEDDVDEDLEKPTKTNGSSRYQTDFIELGILGRGGGGEVVKVRNRLDRRICK